MTRSIAVLLWGAWILTISAAAPALGQSLSIYLEDGRLATGEWVGITGSGSGAEWQFRGEDGSPISVAAADIVGLHGEPPRTGLADTVRLVGGEFLRGKVRAGDADGEGLTLDSPVFGRVPISIDRLDRLALGVVGHAFPRLTMPEGAGEDEVLFVKLTTGVDSLVGTVHQFAEREILFAGDGRDEPRRYAYGRVAGFAVGGGLEREDEPSTWILTRNGDLVAGDVLGLREQVLRFAIEEGREVRIPLAEVAAVQPVSASRVFLSELQPVQVRERSHADPAPLYPWRSDRSVLGASLASGGRAHVRGIGVHSYSALTFRVPKNARYVMGQVGFDESTQRLLPRPDVDIRIRSGQKVLFERVALKGGDAPVNFGRLDVEPDALVTLEVDFGKGMDLADRINWLSVAFLLED